MSDSSSRKRGGEALIGNPPKKIAPGVLNSSESVDYDVTIIVDGERFYCLKKCSPRSLYGSCRELSHHSLYFQRMFYSNFTERDAPEVELEDVVKSEAFDMFLKMIHGEDIVTDVTVEKLLELADYLESAILETSCIQHLGQNSRISLAKQFEMAETYHSEKLMTQVLSCVEDAYQLDEVVPRNLDSFCNTTKNIVLQRSFELLGIRKPSAPPLPEEPDQVFEHMMNQIIDQVEIQHHHGDILENQIELLFLHSFLEDLLPRLSDTAAAETIRDNHHIKALANELRDALEPEEINFIQAQMLALKCKDIYMAIKDLGDRMNQGRESLEKLNNILLNFLIKPAFMISKNKRSHRSFRVTLGDRDIDEIYRDITGRAVRELQGQHIRDITGYPSWIEAINLLNNIVSEMLNVGGRFRKPIPDGVRQVSHRASFHALNETVRRVRCLHYSTERAVQPENEDNENEEGPDHDENDQHQEQDQD
ncbi:hypothetical protein CAEBREN_05130 [Caenorhabditis brenneri]|uniref:BTB domain-containing protein n=1 Tax=Caenorhabditis brenneri TaxID=135651 RepID=G0NP89_CAEBE|nr:hypothetical protein CAEBREN_05130 [Caenorhabditis brenneri]